MYKDAELTPYPPLFSEAWLKAFVNPLETLNHV